MTPQQKADAAGVAMADLTGKNKALADRLSSDWASAGFTLSKAVRADLAMVAAISPADASAITRMMQDPAAVAIVVGALVGPALKGVGEGASVVGRAPAQMLPAVGQGLHNAAVPVTSFLAALASGNTWLRVAEVVLGIVLIVVGLVKLAPPSVARNVKSVGKVAAVL